MDVKVAACEKEAEEKQAVLAEIKQRLIEATEELQNYEHKKGILFKEQTSRQVFMILGYA